MLTEEQWKILRRWFITVGVIGFIALLVSVFSLVRTWNDRPITQTTTIQKSVNPTELAIAIQEYFRANPPQKGEDGVSIKGNNGKDAVQPKDGEDGKDVTAEQIAAAVAAYMEANPPQQGEKGDKGDTVVTQWNFNTSTGDLEKKLPNERFWETIIPCNFLRTCQP